MSGRQGRTSRRSRHQMHRRWLADERAANSTCKGRARPPVDPSSGRRATPSWFLNLEGRRRRGWHAGASGWEASQGTEGSRSDPRSFSRGCSVPCYPCRRHVCAGSVVAVHSRPAVPGRGRIPPGRPALEATTAEAFLQRHYVEVLTYGDWYVWRHRAGGVERWTSRWSMLRCCWPTCSRARPGATRCQCAGRTSERGVTVVGRRCGFGLAELVLSVGAACQYACSRTVGSDQVGASSDG